MGRHLETLLRGFGRVRAAEGCYFIIETLCRRNLARIVHLVECRDPGLDSNLVN